MNDKLAARADVTINASMAKVWNALVNPDVISRSTMGKGRLIAMQPQKRLQYTHFSPLPEAPGTPESHHTVTIEVGGYDGAVHVSLFQDDSENVEAQEASRRTWAIMIEGLKKAVES